MKGGSCSSCLPQTGGSCPCQAKPAFGGSRRTRRQKRARVSRSGKRHTRRQKHRK